MILFILLFAALSLAAQAQDQQTSLSEKEKRMGLLVNQYREENGLSAIPITNSLTKVARIHINDLNTNHPDTKNYGNGDCNTHSWSDQGSWTAVCYAGSDQGPLMWSKPGEITDYGEYGYEIAYWNSQMATALAALNSWKADEPHNDVILERNQWLGSSWKSMGVGIDGNYAVVWFGKEEDPAGSVPGTGTITSQDQPDMSGPVGSAGPTTSQDYPDVEGPDCTESYCTDVNLLHKCVENNEVLEAQGCFLGLFGPPNEQFSIGDGPKAFADAYYAEFKVQTLGKRVQDAPRLVILIDRTVSGGMDLTKDSQFKLNDNPARKLNDFDSRAIDEGKDKFLYKLSLSDLHIGTNELLISPKGDDFSIYKIWIENARGERIWQEKNNECSYQSECVFDDRYNPYQLACDFTATQQVCKEKKKTGEPCRKNFECISGTCSGTCG